jgi:predicted RNA-binding protein
MCLSKAYVVTDGKRELLMEEVASLEIKNGKLLVRTLLGEQKEIKAVVKQIDFLTHTIVLENLRS